MIDKNGNEFIRREGFFLTKRRDKNNRYFLNFKEAGEVLVPSGGFNGLAEAHRFVDFIRPPKAKP